MTNNNPIIELRNTSAIWIAGAILSLVGGWWVSHFFSQIGSETVAKIEKLENELNILIKEGVITSKNWEEITPEERKNQRWATMLQLSPNFSKLVGTGIHATKNISVMKNISQKIGDGSYVSWLEKSWTKEEEEALKAVQLSIGEVIPVFAGIAEMNSTSDIAGKITLKTLLEYIQVNIVEQYNLGHATGQIGIRNVRFIPEAPEIGIYEIPLRFDNVDNESVIYLLEFLGKTGAIDVNRENKNMTITHRDAKPIRNIGGNQSSLKNLLVTVNTINIKPASKENSLDRKSIHTQTKENWDISVTLEFYIRGASKDHIARLDDMISTFLDKGNREGSLIAQGNTLLKTCNTCRESEQIQDIVNLLMQARAAYDSILAEERSANSNFTPIEILSHRTGILTTVETLKKKLENLSTIVNQAQSRI